MRDDTDRSRDGKDPSAARHLKLIHPAPPPKPDVGPRTRGGLRPPDDNDTFTIEEEGRLRASLKHARALFGTWPCLADAMRVPLGAIMLAVRGRNRITAAMAIRLARALGRPVESLYAAPRTAGTCPTCGRGSP